MAETILGAGDLALTGFNFDNPDELGFVLLTNLTAGTKIKFTDNGWQSNGSFRSNEGIVEWTADRDYTAGEIILPSIDALGLSSSGDQILVYQGEDNNPTFLYALNSQGSGWQSDSTDSNTSALPTGLVEGESAIALDEVDNAVYTGINSGTKEELLTSISNTSNWNGSNSTRQSLATNSFDVASPELGAGDIAIIGFSFDNPDEFAFVPLKNIAQGTEIKFTDDGVNSDGSFRGSEGTFTWTADRAYTAGEIIATIPVGMALSSSGDQIIAYTGEESNPTFLYALNSQGSGWQSNATSSNTSALPPGLIDGQSAIALSEVDNAIYSGITSGSQSELLEAISNPVNWSVSNSTQFSMASESFNLGSSDSGSGSNSGEQPTDSIHLLFGNPSDAAFTDFNNYLLVKDQYALSYNDSIKFPNWVSWQLNDTWTGSASRQDDFREDPQLPAELYRVDADDYRNSGFDRGHITPSADRTASNEDNSATFFMTNMMPQAPNNNRNVWRLLEEAGRDFLTEGKEVYLLAGAYGVGGDGSNGFLTEISTPGGPITVPSNTWKTLLVLDEPGLTPTEITVENAEMVAIDLPNSQSVSGTQWQDWRVSVDDLEIATGFDFYSELPDDIELILEAGGQLAGGTALSAGDLALTGFNFDNPDEFSWVFLTNVESGTEISFTENGLLSDGTFRSGEGTFTWSADRAYTAGESVLITDPGFGLSGSGDQIIAYQGTTLEPTFLYALNSEGSNWQSGATDTNTSALPDGLVNGETAIALNEIDNAIYSGITSGSQSELLATISDPANWSGSNSSRQTLSTTSFTLDTTSESSGVPTIFINEFHYDNDGSDTGEAIEIAGTANTDLLGWEIQLYNGNGGEVYGSIPLTGSLANDSNGFGFQSVSFSGIQNGPDGIALVDGDNNLVQFLSYEGSFTGVGGAADGVTSTDIGISESGSTPLGSSLQLTGEGAQFDDFSWTSAAATFESANFGQTFI